MGYDMTWQADTDHDDADFRLNIFGMSRYANAMHRLGMLYEAEPEGPFPNPDDHGTTWEHVNVIEEGDPEGLQLTAAQDASVRAYLKFRDEYLSQHPGDTPGIPSFKFGTNDDWWVTPEECRAALTAYLDAGPADVDLVLSEIAAEYWGRWISYLSQAVEHGGFRVG